MILVDSSVWIEWLRARIEPHRLLAPWINARTAATCGVIRVEVLRGLIRLEQKVRLAELFDFLEDVPTGPAVWTEAADLAWSLDRHGLIVPLTDVVIATCARRAGATLITTDGHFSHVPGLSVLSSLPRFAPD